jgi:hypothetical protein
MKRTVFITLLFLFLRAIAYSPCEKKCPLIGGSRRPMAGEKKN